MLKRTPPYISWESTLHHRLQSRLIPAQFQQSKHTLEISRDSLSALVNGASDGSASSDIARGLFAFVVVAPTCLDRRLARPLLACVALDAIPGRGATQAS